MVPKRNPSKETQRRVCGYVEPVALACHAAVRPGRHPARPRLPRLGAPDTIVLNEKEGTNKVFASGCMKNWEGTCPPPLAGQKTGRRSKRGGRDEGGSRTLRAEISAGGCTKRLGAAGTRGTMWKTASASPPPGGRPRLVADHTHKEPCTKIARAGTCSFLPIRAIGKAHTPTRHRRELSVFIYLFTPLTSHPGSRPLPRRRLSPHARQTHRRARCQEDTLLPSPA